MVLIGIAVTSSLPVFASTSATNTNTVSPALVVNVTVQKAISLTLATGTGCTVAAGSDYSMNLGTVDALAINSGCASKFAPTTPGTTNAVYLCFLKTSSACELLDLRRVADRLRAACWTLY